MHVHHHFHWPMTKNHAFTCTHMPENELYIYIHLGVNCTYAPTSVPMILLKVYHENILVILSRHVSQYITISVYCEIGRVRLSERHIS